MSQRERVTWSQLRVGILVMVSLTILAVGIFFISGQIGLFTRHYTIKAFLPSASDLREGAQVRLAGIMVGNVSHIRLSPYTDPERAVELDLKIARQYQKDIRADSVGTVETVGLLGDSYVDISRGSPGQAVIGNDGSIKTAEKVDITAVVHNANEAITNLRTLSAKVEEITEQVQSGKGTMGQLIYDPSLYKKINATAGTLETLVDHVEHGQGSLGKLMTDDTMYTRTVATLDRVNEVLDQVQHGNGTLGRFMSDPAVYDKMNRLLSDANTMIDNINQGHGSLGKLVTDDKFYSRMNDTVAHLDAITGRMDKGEGTIGKLSTDPTLYNNLTASSQELKEFLADFRKNPKKYLSIKLHIF